MANVHRGRPPTILVGRKATQSPLVAATGSPDRSPKKSGPANRKSGRGKPRPLLFSPPRPECSDFSGAKPRPEPQTVGLLACAEVPCIIQNRPQMDFILVSQRSRPLDYVSFGIGQHECRKRLLEWIRGIVLSRESFDWNEIRFDLFVQVLPKNAYCFELRQRLWTAKFQNGALVRMFSCSTSHREIRHVCSGDITDFRLTSAVDASGTVCWIET